MKKKNKNNLSNFLSGNIPCCRVSEKLDVPLLKKKL